MRRLFDDLPVMATGAYGAAMHSLTGGNVNAVTVATTWEEHELDKHYQAIAPKQERYCNHD